VADGKGRIANDAVFSMCYAPPDGWGGDLATSEKLNPNLIDPSGTPLHVWTHDPASAGEAQ
jgi:hypothetical protein